MDRQHINKQIRDVFSDITRLSNALYAMESTDIQRYPDNYEVLSTEAALRGEKITCALRRLVYSTSSVKNPDYLVSAGAVQGINIDWRDGVMDITLPCLLPKRKQRHSSDFLLDPLRCTLEKFAETNPMPKYRECVVCFSHIYRQDAPGKAVRDYDNLELKQFLDVIASFIMIDDNGLLCDAYHTTEMGETDCTRIAVMNRASLPEWLKSKERRLKNISHI